MAHFGRLIIQLLWPAAAGSLLWLISERAVSLLTQQEHQFGFPGWLFGCLMAILIYMGLSFLRRPTKYTPQTLVQAIFGVVHPVMLILSIHGLNESPVIGAWLLAILFFVTAVDHYAIIESGEPKRNWWLLILNFGFGLILIFLALCGNLDTYFWHFIIVSAVLSFWIVIRKPLCRTIA